MRISARVVAAVCLVAMLSILLLPGAASACGRCTRDPSGGPFCRLCVADPTTNAGCEQLAPCVCEYIQCFPGNVAQKTAASARPQSFAAFLTGAASAPAAAISRVSVPIAAR
jgi:hypothetical protein